MKRLLVSLGAVMITGTSVLSVVACGPSKLSPDIMRIYADGDNDAKALTQICDNFKSEYGLTNLKCQVMAVDMKTEEQLMITNPEAVQTDLFNMPHDYISEMHNSRAMTNLDDVNFADGSSAQKSRYNTFGVKSNSAGDLIAPNGKVMALPWQSFLSTVYKDWDNGGKVYGKPINKDIIDKIAIFERDVNNKLQRFDYIWPSTYQSPIEEVNTNFKTTIDGKTYGDKELKDMSVQEMLKMTSQSGFNTAQGNFNSPIMYTDFNGDFTTSSLLQEQKVDDKGNQQKLDWIGKNGWAFPVGDIKPDGTYKDSTATADAFKANMINMIDDWIDNIFTNKKSGSAIQQMSDYESNGKLEKGKFAQGNLYANYTATWDLAGAIKEEEPGGSLDPHNVNLEFRKPAPYWTGGKADPLLMVGGFGTYKLSHNPEISTAFIQYLARTDQTKVWMQQSRGLMFDNMATNQVIDDVQKILDNHDSADKKNQEITAYFHPTNDDAPYINTTYAKMWIAAMKVAMSAASDARLATPQPGWSAYLGEFHNLISRLYDKTANNSLASFKKEISSDNGGVYRLISAIVKYDYNDQNKQTKDKYKWID